MPVLSLLSIALLLAAAQAAPQAPTAPPLPDDAAFTTAILAELRQQNPDAATLFEQAQAARDQGELSRAGQLYGQVTQLLPASDHAWRRHCVVLQDAGMRDQALPRCRTALDLNPRPENRVALAYTLLDVPSGEGASAADRAEARDLLEAARAVAPDDPTNARLRCKLAMDQDDIDLLRVCVADLDRVAKDQVMTSFYAWSLAFREHRWRDALHALDQAQAAGMPGADAESFRALTRKARPRWTVWGPALGIGAVLGAAVWLIGGAWRRRATARHTPTTL
ncbi:MAG: hypothetical protein GXP62_19820 [Oligoflexia bacterium]|nr:hypothetical protein [Oligoflexia bacterium]